MDVDVDERSYPQSLIPNSCTPPSHNRYCFRPDPNPTPYLRSDRQHDCVKNRYWTNQRSGDRTGPGPSLDRKDGEVENKGRG